MLTVNVLLAACSAVSPTGSSAATSPDTATNKSVPTNPADLPKEIVGAWRNTTKSPDIVFLQIFYTDGTVRGIDNVTTLMNPGTFSSDKYRIQGRNLIVDQAPTQHGSCTISTTMRQLADGMIEMDPQTLSSGCQGAGWGQQKLTRLSPASAAGQALSAPSEASGSPVTDSIQLQGVWLIQGTGQLFAYDDKSNAQYRLDDQGKIGNEPADRGTLQVTDSGDLILTSNGGTCTANTKLTHGTVAGTPPVDALHVTVAQDSCHRFPATEITLIHII